MNVRDPSDKPEFSVEETTQVVAVGLGHASQEVRRRDRCTLTVLAGPTPGAILSVDGDEIVIGRGRDASARIDDPGMSRRHARVFRKADGYFIEDLGSTNGTFVEGEQVAYARQLKDGDRIQIGRNSLLQVALQDEAEHRAVRELYESAVRDPLTRVYNRRHLDERLKGEFAYATRHRTAVSVLVIDVDHFKNVNDTLGHAAGDAVLRSLSASISRIVRTEDLVARYGGEEFVVVARGIESPNAMKLAERIRVSIAMMEVLWNGTPVSVTVSIGSATLSAEVPYTGPDALLAAADRALYQAKSAGRNRVVAA